MAKNIAIGADHGGFPLKEKIKEALKKAHYRIDDVGTSSSEACDYPRFGFAVAEKVSTGEAARGILICKTGIGMAVIANKYPSVRAGVCNSTADALSARRHNDTNVLVLAATKVSAKKALDITRTWLRTEALKGRHARRVRQIDELEKKVFKKSK
ncbi:MAG: ribose 5-phosphate isomerase B [Candidatus Omnitrophota bacterium]